MSEQEATKFIEFVGRSPDLQAELEALSGAGVMRRLVELGEKHGFRFSEEDYRQAVVALADGELSEEALEEVLREAGLKG